MVGERNGTAALLDKYCKENGSERDLIKIHCLIHQEALCAKSMNLKDVMEIIVKSVNFIRSRGLNHRQFQELVKEMNSEYGDLLYYCEVRWLSRGAMLKRVYDLKGELDNSMRSKGMVIPQFTDSSWLSDFAFLVDDTDHLNNSICVSKVKHN